MIEGLTRAEYHACLRNDFALFVARCFPDLSPQTELAMSWHLEVIAAKLAAVREGLIRRLIINLPPRHLKSLMASVAFPAWCLGHDPSAQILCVSYAQDLADKHARDSRSIMMSPWYQRIFRTRLAPHRQAVQEFVTTRQGYRLATSNGGVLTGRGADFIMIDDPLKPEEALSAALRRACNDWYDHTLYAGSMTSVMAGSSSLCSGCTRTIWSVTCWRRSPGRSSAFRRSPRSTRCMRSTRSGARAASGVSGARRCTPSASHSRHSLISGGRSASTTLLASISNPPRRWAGVWSRPNGSSVITTRNDRSALTASCRAGTPPTRRPSSVILASARLGVSAAKKFISWVCCASGSNIPHSSARCANSRTCSVPMSC